MVVVGGQRVGGRTLERRAGQRLGVPWPHVAVADVVGQLHDPVRVLADGLWREQADRGVELAMEWAADHGGHPRSAPHAPSPHIRDHASAAAMSPSASDTPCSRACNAVSPSASVFTLVLMNGLPGIGTETVRAPDVRACLPSPNAASRPTLAMASFRLRPPASFDPNCFASSDQPVDAGDDEGGLLAHRPLKHESTTMVAAIETNDAT